MALVCTLFTMMYWPTISRAWVKKNSICLRSSAPVHSAVTKFANKNALGTSIYSWCPILFGHFRPPSPPKIQRHLLMIPFHKCFDPVICSGIEKDEPNLIHFLAMPFKKCTPNDLKYFISCDSQTYFVSVCMFFSRFESTQLLSLVLTRPL